MMNLTLTFFAKVEGLCQPVMTKKRKKEKKKKDR